MLLELLDGIFNERLNGEIAKVMEALYILTGNRRWLIENCEHVVATISPEVDSAALLTAKSMHSGRFLPATSTSSRPAFT